MHAYEKELAPADALRRASGALARARKAGSKKDECIASLDAVDAILDKDGPAAALAPLVDAQAVASKLGHEDLELRALQLASQVAAGLGDASQALEKASEMLTLAQQRGSKAEVASAHCAVARAQVLGGSAENALKEANEALAIYRELGDVQEQAAALLLLTTVHGLAGREQEAERSARYGLRLFREAGRGRGAAAALQALVQLYVGNGQFVEARRLVEGELAEMREEGNTKGEAAALRALVLALAAGEDAEGALQAADDGMRRLVELGDRMEEARMMLAIANVRAGTGQGEEAIAVLRQATALFKKLGSRDGERDGLEMLARIHEAKGMDMPNSAFRAEVLGLLGELGHFARERDAQGFDRVVTRISKIGRFFSKKELMKALGPLEEEGLLDFLRAQAPSELVDLALRASGGEDEEKPGAARAMSTARFRQADWYIMYSSLRFGAALVYGPRFRQIHAFVPRSGGALVVHAVCRPSFSTAQDWELEGWDWNPAVIDAGAHAGFALSQANQ